MQELVAWAKANPGKLSYASVGNGSSSHLNMELLKSVAGFDAVHVPFNGSPPAVTATIQGETQMMFAVMQPLQAQMQAGKLRALAVTTAKRFPLLPDLPTIAESGYPGFEALAWNGVMVPAATPKPVIARLNAEMNAILKQPDVIEKMQASGLRSHRRHARGFRQSDQARDRDLDAGDPEARPQGRLGAAGSRWREGRALRAPEDEARRALPSRRNRVHGTTWIRIAVGEPRQRRVAGRPQQARSSCR